jgi:hypothetical protein
MEYPKNLTIYDAFLFEEQITREIHKKINKDYYVYLPQLGLF